MLKKNGFIFAAAMLLGGSFNALAEESAQVLFKLHNVTPVTNSSGLIQGCEFSATFYNRTGSDISNASVDLSWQDDVVNNAIKNEQAQEQKTSSTRRRATARASTASLDTGKLFVKINLPPLKNDRQITLKNKVNTDKCYLLLGDVDINIASCSFDGKNDKACANMFHYVTSSDQQYYVDFKDVSIEEEQTQEKSQQEKINAEIDAAYKKTIENLQSVSSSLLAK